MNIRRNAPWNIAEVVATVLVQLVIYRIIIQQLGIVALGIWSLVFSTLAFARVADLGMANGLTRFIARPPGTDDGFSPPIAYIETAMTGTLILYVVLGAIAYIPANYALAWAVKGGHLIEARGLLPYAVVTFILVNLSAVTSSALVGFHQSGKKSVISVLGLGVQLIASLAAVRSYGLIGLALAQICQNLFLILAGWVTVLSVAEAGVRWSSPFKFNMRAFREMVGLGVRLQVLNIATFLYDPLTKFVFSAVAGPAALGVYEAVYRLVFQARALLTAPAQNLPPMFAAMDNDAAGRAALYQKAVAMMILIAALGFFLVVLASPVVSIVLLNGIRTSYILWVVILAAGWTVNIAAMPAYFMGIGGGWVRWCIIGSAFNTIVSPVLGYVLGVPLGGLGVVIGAAAGIAGGAIVMAIANCRIAGVRLLPPSTAYGHALGQVWRQIPFLQRDS